MSSPVLKSISICNDDIEQTLFSFRRPRVILKSISICGAMYRILKVVDSNGNALSGASVSITDSDEFEETGTTEADGTYSSYLNGDNLTNPCTVEISLAGYQTFLQEVNITDRIDWLVQLADEASGGGSQIINGSFIRGC